MAWMPRHGNQPNQHNLLETMIVLDRLAYNRLTSLAIKLTSSGRVKNAAKPTLASFFGQIANRNFIGDTPSHVHLPFCLARTFAGQLLGQ